MKKQEKLYLSHEAVELLQREKEQTTLSKSAIVELLIRQHLTHGSVVGVKQETEKGTQDGQGEDFKALY